MRSRRRPGSAVWEGVQVEAVEAGAEGVRLTVHDGRRLAARRALIATGPWLAREPLGGGVAPGALRVKKIVALHLPYAPEPDAPGLVFFADDAYLVPLHRRGHWLFSFTSDEWDVAPEPAALAIGARDRALARAILDRHAPALSELAVAGRVFCNAYTADRLPFVAAAGGGRLAYAWVARGRATGSRPESPPPRWRGSPSTRRTCMLQPADPAAARSYLLSPVSLVPNGRAHLGHIGGPLLKIDVLARHLRRRGDRVVVASTSDVYESHMLVKAYQEGRPVEQLCAANFARIAADLAALDIVYDEYVNPLDPRWSARYAAHNLQTMEDLVANGATEIVRERIPFAPNGRPVVGGWFVGTCPDCGAGAAAISARSAARTSCPRRCSRPARASRPTSRSRGARCPVCTCACGTSTGCSRTWRGWACGRTSRPSRGRTSSAAGRASG